MERLWFSTDVIRASTGAEQLRSTTTTPRRMFEYEFELDAQMRRQMASRIFKHGAGRWQVPVWVDGVALAVPLAAGSTSVPIAKEWREFAPGYAVIIGDDPTQAEVLTVSAVTPSALTVSATVSAWPAGSMVYPAFVGRIDGPWTAQAFTDSATFGTARVVSAQANPSAEIAPVTEYRGVPVFDFCPQSNAPEYGADRIVTVLDDGVGVPFQWDSADMAFPTQQVMVTVTDPEDAARLRGLIYWLDGMRQVLWVPTFLHDLKPISASGTSLVVEACNYSHDANMAMGRRDVRILATDATVYFRRIVSCSAAGSTEVLTLDSAIPVTATQIKLVSFMALCRSDSDNFELVHWHGDVSCALTFRAVRYDV